MEVHIGQLRVELSGHTLFLDEHALMIGNWLTRLSKPKSFFTWDCQTQTANPDPIPPSASAKTRLRIPDRRIMTFLGPVEFGVPRVMVAASGLASMDAFKSEIARLFPPLVVDIDWDTIWEPFKDNYSLKFVAQTHYLQCVGRPYGLDLVDRFTS
ncbi:MAG: hypothetical protein ACR2O1_05035 [Boseongicola sp.]